MYNTLIRFTSKNLRPLRKIQNSIRGVILFRFSKLIIRMLRPNLILTYDNSTKPDGVGAQIQRILAIRSMAQNLGLGYLHTGIHSVAVHPLDPYQSQSELVGFVKNLNHVFYIESTAELNVSTLNELEVRSLTFVILFRNIFKSVIQKRTVLVRCLEPYGVSDHDPNIYLGIRDFLPHFKPISHDTFTLGIHYRRGVGGMAVQNGESISRELNPNYFITIANRIAAERLPSTTSIQLYTDAPKNDLEFLPPADQSELWKNSPRFENGVMSVLGANPEILFDKLLVAPVIVRGGDPLQVIRELAGLDVLIMSRSSFSYVGAVLNDRGKIYFPKSFWHSPMIGWKVVNEGGINH